MTLLLIVDLETVLLIVENARLNLLIAAHHKIEQKLIAVIPPTVSDLILALLNLLQIEIADHLADLLVVLFYQLSGSAAHLDTRLVPFHDPRFS
jgi:hypothetical protein